MTTWEPWESYNARQPAPAAAPPSAAPRPAVVNGALATSPSYLAFLRALGIEDATAATDTTTATERVGRNLATTLPRIADAGTLSRENISGSYESRGLYRSGQHEVSLARQRSDEGQASGDAVGAGVDQITELQAALARRRADIARRRAEGALSAAPSAYLDQMG